MPFTRRRQAWAALAGILALAFVLRVWSISTVPPGLDPDEAAIGYNAYSLLRTGRDEYGVAWPLLFQSFGDWKRPTAIYAAIPPIALLGPTAAAVRFPAAIAGVLSVAALYAIGTALLRSRRLGLLAASLLAISPWHLQFTRTAREAAWLVLALLVMVAALLYAFRARRERAGPLYVVAALAFLVAAYSYHSGPLLAPALAAIVAMAYWPRLMRAPRAWLTAALALVALGLMPLLVEYASGRAGVRLAQASILRRADLVALSQSRAAHDAAAGMPSLLHHPLALAARAGVDNYLSHFDPTFLFTRGDREWRHHAPDTGQFLLWDLPLVLAGVAVLAQSIRGRRRPGLLVVGAWLLVAPLPASLAENAPHAIRAIALVPAWYLLAAAGAPRLWRWLRGHGFQWDYVVLLGLSLAFYLVMYHRYYPVEHGRSWSSGVAEGFRAAQAMVDSGRYRQVVVFNRSGFNYVQGLYATGYDPAAYLAEGGTQSDVHDEPHESAAGVVAAARREGFGAFEFRDIDWRAEPRRPDVLYLVGGGTGLPAGAHLVATIRGAGGYEAVLLVSLSGG